MYERIIAAGIAAAIAVAVALPSIAAGEGIVVSDAYARETPPSARIGGAYMTIANHGAANRLVGARSDGARVVRIHDHTMDDAGVMRMRAVEVGVPLGEHETVVLAPGGLHIMLVDLESPLKKGEAVDIVLDFEDGTVAHVSVPVLSISATGPDSHGTKHDHGSMADHDH